MKIKIREIVIITTVGHYIKIYSRKYLWKNIRPTIFRKLREVRVTPNKVKIVQSINRQTIEHPKAKLSTKDTTLFILPIKIYLQ